MSRLRSSITANPSEYAAKIFKTVTWKFTPAPPDQRHMVGACGEGLAADLPEVLGRELAPGGGL